MKPIKTIRKTKKTTPPKMEKLLDISLSKYFDKETGRRKFKPHEIVRICIAFEERIKNIVNFYS